jgi:hypothetical protein
MIPKTYFQKFQTKKYSSLGILTGTPKRYFISNYINSLNKIIELISPNCVIELGCGEGFVCGILNSKFKDINFSGADINKNDLDLLEQKFPDIQTYNLDLNYILNSPISQKKINTILCLETLEHLKKPQKFLSDLRQLKYDDLIISVPWEPFFQISNFMRGSNLKKLGNDPEHLNQWNKKQISDLLSKNFTIKKHIISFPWQIIWLK